MTRACGTSNLLVLSIDGTVTLRQKELHGLDAASNGSDHEQRVARLVCAELVRVTHQPTAHQPILYQ